MDPHRTVVTQSTQSTDAFTLFGRFRISSTQIFYRSESGLSFGMVNLRPIVPGHVLVVPTRVVPTLDQLTDTEYEDLWCSVRCVQKILQRHYFPNYNNDPQSFGFNVAVQDGVAAGQSVPHVHVHILPRRHGLDFVRNDDVYDALQDWAPTSELRQWKLSNGLGHGSLHVPADEQRRDRTMEEMNMEASLYRDVD